MRLILTLLAVITMLATGLMADGLHELPATSNCTQPTGLERPSPDQLTDQPPAAGLPDFQTWENLKDIHPSDRSLTTLEILVADDLSAVIRAEANRIQSDWNAGSHDTALDRLEGLTRLIERTDIEVGLTWLASPTAQQLNRDGTDVRIGTIDSVYQTALVVDSDNGHLMAFLLAESGGSSDWFAYFSNDDGQTWNSRYAQYLSYLSNDLDAVVVDGYAYVGVTKGYDQTAMVLYKFRMSDGHRVEFPTGGYSRTAIDVGPSESLLDIGIGSNEEISANPRVYPFGIASTGELLFKYSNDSCDVFVDKPTGVTDALQGLSGSFNKDFSDYYFVFSWMDSSENLNIAGISAVGAIGFQVLYTTSSGSPNNDETAISAYRDTIHCFYEFAGQATSKYLRYQVSYNGGDNWYWGVVDDTTVYHECPAVDAHGGGGVGAIYRIYTTPRELRFTWRDYHGYPWQAPESMADHQPYYQPGSIRYLDDGIYGIVYMSWNNPVVRGAYFDLYMDCCEGTRGNIDGDPSDAINIVDITWFASYLFTGGDEPPCKAEADVNSDGDLNIVDLTYMAAYLFTGGEPPDPC